MSELVVKYGRTRPDLFKDGSEVIVAGQYLDGIFYADELQTKCASRYEGDLRNENSYNLSEIEQCLQLPGVQLYHYHLGLAYLPL